MSCPRRHRHRCVGALAIVLCPKGCVVPLCPFVRLSVGVLQASRCQEAMVYQPACFFGKEFFA